MNYPDKLGCYRVGDLKFYSKLQAIEMHTKTGIHPHWDFNEAVFDSYDWTVEPAESLRELYRARAQQLRDQYDYIVLMYSGGADSHNVLMSFLNNDIKLDEVASMSNQQATGDKNSWMNTEIFNVAIPTVEYFKENYPWLKYRLIDNTQWVIDYFTSAENKFDWIYEMNMLFNPGSACRESIGLKIKEWADIIHSGKKLCILSGLDKPRVAHVNGKFCVRFLDMIDLIPTVKGMAGELPYADELFYWTPDMPELIIKQAHLIKNYLNRNPISQLPFVSESKSDLAFKKIDNKTYWLSNHGMHTLIYPDWDINTLTTGKTPKVILTNRDIWFWNLEETNTISQNFWIGLDKLWETVPDYWKNNPADVGMGLKGCVSKDYFLE